MMNQEWSLDPLYKGYDDPDFIRDMNLVPAKIEEFRKVVASLGQGDVKDDLIACLKAQEELEAFSYRLMLFLNLKQSVNSADEQAASGMAKVGMRMSTLGKDFTVAEKWIASIEDLQAVIDSDPFLKEYEYRLLRIQKDSAHLLSDDVEDVISRLDLSAGRAWGDLQTYLTSGVEVDYNGETTTLSGIRNMAYEADPAIRKAAYEAELACYPKIADSVAFALNNIKSQVNTITELRGFASPLDMTLDQAHMTRATLEAMLASINKYLPKFHEYLKAKAKLLGHKNGLPWYDLFAPVGNSN
ncbi:MAG: peptidase M3, partial [Lachnospiraceae bacterium]|nr:peptidase M3 [Lachnospiraceae bacterium]